MKIRNYKHSYLNQRHLDKERRIAVSKKHRKHNVSKKKKNKKYKQYIETKRKQLLINAHSSFTYNQGKKKIDISGEFGLEDSSTFDSFIQASASMIDFDEKTLIINLQHCTRVWPSAVTLMCSLIEWIEFGSRYNHIPLPSIISTDSCNDDVNSYLTHCGFHDYVRRNHKPHTKKFDNNRIVKIEREYMKDSERISKREDAIIKLLEDNTNFTTEDIKLYCSTVILEVFLNIQEHGLNCNDKGWWILAQYHEEHKIVSINIADNGIGFKNSLLSGPQALQIRQELGNDSEKEGVLILHAMKENISGAIDASIKENRFFHHGYVRGSGRGNGLDRIKSTCAQLGVEFSILSHYGFLSYDKNGEIVKTGTSINRVFAGTLYHFNFPAIKGVNL